VPDGADRRGSSRPTQDKASVYDWEEINSNKAEFKDVIEKCNEEQDSIVVWICSFCENKNIVGCD